MSAAMPTASAVLNARDLLTDARNLIEAMYMMAADLDRTDCNAFQRVAMVAKETVQRADVFLGGEDDGEGE